MLCFRCLCHNSGAWRTNGTSTSTCLSALLKSTILIRCHLCLPTTTLTCRFTRTRCHPRGSSQIPSLPSRRPWAERDLGNLCSTGSTPTGTTTAQARMNQAGYNKRYIIHESILFLKRESLVCLNFTLFIFFTDELQ